MAASLVLSCEHGGNHVPVRWRRHFEPYRDLLRTHRGYDLGALPLADALARRHGVELVGATTTRLLVDLNRSLHHPRLHAPWIRQLHADERARIVEEIWHPHRRAIVDALDEALEVGPVLHVAVHSFTPKLGEDLRDFEIGLLYDPSRDREKRVAQRWQEALRAAAPELRVRRNAPYRGGADGLATALRKVHGDRDYAGIELELNQAFVAQRGAEQKAQIELLAATLGDVLAST